MNEVITERNYPIEGKWIFKSVWGPALVLLFLVPYFFIEMATGRFSFYVIIYLAFVPIHIIIVSLQRANFHYSIEDKFMVLHQGILSKQQRNIPYGVIQNIFVKQDLFDRIFGLASLTVENASQGAGSQNAGTSKIFGMTVSNQKRQQGDTVGFSGNKISIPGLTKANAETLKSIVLTKMKENPIEDSQSGL